jgi:hypothetical protein
LSFPFFYREFIKIFISKEIEDLLSKKKEEEKIERKKREELIKKIRELAKQPKEQTKGFDTTETGNEHIIAYEIYNHNYNS